MLAKCSRLFFPSLRTDFDTVLPKRMQPTGAGGGGGGGAVLRGQWSEGAGPLPRNRVPVSPQPGGRVFPRDHSKAHLRGQSSVRGRAGAEDLLRSPSLSDRQEPGPPPPASPVGLLRDARGIEGRRRSRPYLALRTKWSRPTRSAPLPGYLGPCRWTSGPETGPAWRSWRAGRR